MSRTAWGVWGILLALIVVMLAIQFLPGPNEGQPVGGVKSPEQTVPAPVVDVPKPKHLEPTGERIEVQDQNRWIAAVAVDQREGEVLVHYPGQSPDLDAWVPEGSVRFLSHDEDVRDCHWKGEAEVRGRWRPCEILKRNGSRFLVHYIGESAYYDEWLASTRLHLPAEAR